MTKFTVKQRAKLHIRCKLKNIKQYIVVLGIWGSL